MDRVLEREVMPPIDNTTVIYGQSMGALIGYRLCRIAERHGKKPRALCVAAHRPPALPVRYDADEQGDREPLHELAGRTGAEDGASVAEELPPLIIPTIQADLAPCEAFVATPEDRLRTPVLAVPGAKDHEVPPTSMDSWRVWTDGQSALRSIDGDHFFARNHPAEILGHISEFLNMISSGNDPDPGQGRESQ